jgi:hypothetical protein
LTIYPYIGYITDKSAWPDTHSVKNTNRPLQITQSTAPPGNAGAVIVIVISGTLTSQYSLYGPDNPYNRRQVASDVLKKGRLTPRGGSEIQSPD